MCNVVQTHPGTGIFQRQRLCWKTDDDTCLTDQPLHENSMHHVESGAAVSDGGHLGLHAAIAAAVGGTARVDKALQGRMDWPPAIDTIDLEYGVPGWCIVCMCVTSCCCNTAD
jgi:hypothetical protein